MPQTDIRVDLTGTNYEPQTKTWYGPPYEQEYDTEQTIGELVYVALQRDAQKIIQICDEEGVSMTKRELLDNAVRLATQLRSMHIDENDIIGIVSFNTTHLAALCMACLFNGTPFHAINRTLATETIRKLFDITKPALIFCDNVFYSKTKAASCQLAVPIFTLDPKERIPGTRSILDLLQASCTNAEFKPRQFKNGIARTMAIVCSSGTTGTPKAVTITNSRKIFECFSYLCEDDILYASSGIDWITSLIMLLASIMYNATRIITTQQFSPAIFLHLLSKYKLTTCLTSSYNVARLAHTPNISKADFVSLRHFNYGGSKCALEVQRRMCTLLEHESVLRNGYGLTEVACFIANNFRFLEKPLSVGKLFPGIKIRIVDDFGNSVGPNEPGELYVDKGDNWNGYYGNAAATQATMTNDGWIMTGDIAHFDDDGYLYLIDRKKEMLKYEGMMYYPTDIEEIIARMPEVAEVCVFGIWNELKRDVAAAAVIPKEHAKLNAKDVIEFVERSTTEQFKHLNAGAIIVDKLIYTANGKLNRRAIKELYEKDLINQIIVPEF